MAGYNALTGARVKLGRWPEYLAMRTGILRLNVTYRELLSNDLGAIGGFLFDVGSGRYPAPPLSGDAQAEERWRADLAQVRDEAAKDAKRRADQRDADHTHTSVQGWLRDLGHALGFRVWIASNDRGRPLGDGTLGDGCLTELPGGLGELPGADTVRLIDVLWIDDADHVAAAFEVEHSTSIYSGIVRMLDLAYGAPDAVHGLYVVAPDAREHEVRAQLARPAFSRIGRLRVRYLPYGELEHNRVAMARFGRGLAPLEAIARSLSP